MMKLKSISRRVYRTILAVSVVCMVAMVMTVLLINEDLERTMLKVEFAQERDFILKNKTSQDVLVWDTPSLAIVFVPGGKALPAAPPPIFRGLPNDYSAEIELGSETYLVTVEPVDSGILYVAKNITHFEDREALFDAALIVMTLVIIAFSLLLALLSSRRIVRPLKLLSQRITRIPVGPNMPRMETDYVDAELYSIAMTFNRFLDELESYVRREQALLSLASHELRTPLAVMSGALDVLEVRGQLNSSDQATLRRVRRSCDEMMENVNILLKLAHRAPVAQTEVFDVCPVAQQVIDDLKISHHAGDRVVFDAQSPLVANTDAGMVRMVLRNLIQNALQHTASTIRVTVSQNMVEIEDQGQGLTRGQQAVLHEGKSIPLDASGPTGLGLYIVTLATERLGWQLDIAQTGSHGTRIQLTPNRQPPRS
ncbi:MAG TPA: HAMP domain-containing sensor histidine kinase [Candidimonas sp.]|nr:HAMP domain-containing sensor histidine kinase [Candidimonas sp.]